MKKNYRFYSTADRVIAVSTYAGRIVRGVAICAENDQFSIEIGKKLAAARCNAKIAHKRRNRAERKFKEAVDAMKAAEAQLAKMTHYFNDSMDAEKEALVELDNLYNELASN